MTFNPKSADIVDILLSSFEKWDFMTLLLSPVYFWATKSLIILEIRIILEFNYYFFFFDIGVLSIPNQDDLLNVFNVPVIL